MKFQFVNSWFNFSFEICFKSVSQLEKKNIFTELIKVCKNDD